MLHPSHSPGEIKSVGVEANKIKAQLPHKMRKHLINATISVSDETTTRSEALKTSLLSHTKVSSISWIQKSLRADNTLSSRSNPRHVQTPPANVTDDLSELSTDLLWLPYIVLTLILTSLLVASFLQFHCKNGHKYQRRRAISVNPNWRQKIIDDVHNTPNPTSPDDVFWPPYNFGLAGELKLHTSSWDKTQTTIYRDRNPLGVYQDMTGRGRASRESDELRLKRLSYQRDQVLFDSGRIESKDEGVVFSSRSTNHSNLRSSRTVPSRLLNDVLADGATGTRDRGGMCCIGTVQQYVSNRNGSMVNMR